MKKLLSACVFAALLAFPAVSQGGVINTYTIGTFSGDGYSATVLHSANRSAAGDARMSGNVKYNRLTGSLEGMTGTRTVGLNTTDTLTGITGSFGKTGITVDITDGALEFKDGLTGGWLDITVSGAQNFVTTMFFEHHDFSGSRGGGPNEGEIDDSFSLWGQNIRYRNFGGSDDASRWTFLAGLGGYSGLTEGQDYDPSALNWGSDIHADFESSRDPVPEPASLAIFGAVAGLGFVTARRRKAKK